MIAFKVSLEETLTFEKLYQLDFAIKDCLVNLSRFKAVSFEMGTQSACITDISATCKVTKSSLGRVVNHHFV